MNLCLFGGITAFGLLVFAVTCPHPTKALQPPAVTATFQYPGQPSPSPRPVFLDGLSNKKDKGTLASIKKEFDDLNSSGKFLTGIVTGFFAARIVFRAFERLVALVTFLTAS